MRAPARTSYDDKSVLRRTGRSESHLPESDRRARLRTCGAVALLATIAGSAGALARTSPTADLERRNTWVICHLLEGDGSYERGVGGQNVASLRLATRAPFDASLFVSYSGAEVHLTGDGHSGDAQVEIFLLDDNGPSGAPGDVLFSRMVDVSGVPLHPEIGRYLVGFGTPVAVEGGAFIAVALNVAEHPWLRVGADESTGSAGDYVQVNGGAWTPLEANVPKLGLNPFTLTSFGFDPALCSGQATPADYECLSTEQEEHRLAIDADSGHYVRQSEGGPIFAGWGDLVRTGDNVSLKSALSDPLSPFTLEFDTASSLGKLVDAAANERAVLPFDTASSLGKLVDAAGNERAVLPGDCRDIPQAPTFLPPATLLPQEVRELSGAFVRRPNPFMKRLVLATVNPDPPGAANTLVIEDLAWPPDDSNPVLLHSVQGLHFNVSVTAGPGDTALVTGIDNFDPSVVLVQPKAADGGFDAFPVELPTGDPFVVIGAAAFPSFFRVIAPDDSTAGVLRTWNVFLNGPGSPPTVESGADLALALSTGFDHIQMQVASDALDTFAILGQDPQGTPVVACFGGNAAGSPASTIPLQFPVEAHPVVLVNLAPEFVWNRWTGLFDGAVANPSSEEWFFFSASCESGATAVVRGGDYPIPAAVDAWNNQIGVANLPGGPFATVADSTGGTQQSRLLRIERDLAFPGLSLEAFDVGGAPPFAPGPTTAPGHFPYDPELAEEILNGEAGVFLGSGSVVAAPFAAASCTRDPGTLCLNDGRFEIEVDWETSQGTSGFGRAVPLTGDTGYFWFFDPANVELVVKVLDACPSQFESFWIFAAGLTDVATRLHVRDTLTGFERTYENPQKTAFLPLQDTAAFPTCLPGDLNPATAAATAPAPESGTVLQANAGAAGIADHLVVTASRRAYEIRAADAASGVTPREQNGCEDGPTTLCLSGGRFRVQVQWKTKGGDSGQAQAVPLTGDTGYFWFFDPGNIELVVKVLDACSTVFDRVWVFAAGLTNVEVEIVVYDTVADEEVRYTNPLDRPFQPIQDTQAFATCE